nr:hypothetical protein [uncultured Actinoplanes sp.]
MPLWIGTVADVEDLLPATPGMFDPVVIDEASPVDQVRRRSSPAIPGSCGSCRS